MTDLDEGGGSAMMGFYDNVRVLTDQSGKVVKSITIDGEELLIDTFRHYNPITEEYLGGDRYVKE